MKRKAIVGLLAAMTVAGAEEFDVVVYGGTAGGVMAAVTAAREGLRVVLLEPGRHVGGMFTGGLSRTDYGKKEVIGGYAREVYWRLGNHYETRRFGQDEAWYYEPRVGEQILKEMLEEVKVPVRYGHRLRAKTGVKKTGTRIGEIVMENGAAFTGKIYMDASYEGDLMAQAGVTYTVGRESSAQYGETLAGVRDRTPLHQFEVNVNPYGPDGKLLPEISAVKLPAPGTADKAVQAYNFRMILSNDPHNRVAFPRPAAYDSKRYELLARMLEETVKQKGRAPVLNEVTLVAPIPNRKADFNNRGAFSTDFIGRSWEYPDADYAGRERIWKEHVEYVKGFFYFLANDTRVPKSLQDEVREWGLAADEYIDTEHWPHQLYVREARRMVGEYVLVQKDMQTELTKPDPIGMGSYNSDSHNVQRIVNAQGFAENEGDMQVAVKPYQIPYRILLPKRNEATNLLVPVCFSASHVAYSSARMEPQYMMMGQAAGVAARMAIESGKAPQEIDVGKLVERLRGQGVVMEYRPGPGRPVWKGFRQGIRN
jgi:hypothetical protein